MGMVESRSRGKDQVKSSAKPRGKDQTRSQPRSQGVRQPVSQGDVDTVLVGRRVLIVVSVGNGTARVVGRVVAMGRFWVIVSVEESELSHVQGTAYLNKGSIVAYIPLPDNNPNP
jgi:hypothetical protein